MNLKTIRSDRHLLQISRFGLIGILNTIVGYGAFLVLLNYSNYLVSITAAHAIGVTHSYLWNRYWVFNSDGTKLREFLRFNSVYALVLLANIIILYAFVNILRFDPRIGQLITLPIITIISFTGHKYWSFKNK